ncbi:MAG: hypothetical protein ACE5Q6_22635, partial [Dehalococcoidia bacterium]
VSKRTIESIESGRHAVQGRTALQIADTLQTEISELLGSDSPSEQFKAEASRRSRGIPRWLFESVILVMLGVVLAVSLLSIIFGWGGPELKDVTKFVLVGIIGSLATLLGALIRNNR